MSSRPTITAVAKKARVAASTVSRVLNGGYASPDVKARVEKVIAALDYTPSPTARNLKMNRTGCIGLAVETSQGAWFMQLLGGIEEALVEAEHSVLLSSLRRGSKYDSGAVAAWISERRVDGLIWVRAGTRDEKLVRLATDARLPLVFIAPDADFRVGQIFRSRNADAGEVVARHLVGLGHRKIAFVGGPRESIDTIERLRGLRLGLHEKGIELEPDHVVFSHDYSSEGGIEYGHKWLKMPRTKAHTAVVLGNDTLALGFMRTLLQNRVAIPDEVSVVGFDGVDEGGLAWPGLTTVRQETRDIGATACRSVLRQLEERTPEKPSLVELPMELVVRESTGPARQVRRGSTV